MNYGYTIPDAFLQGNSIHFRNWQSKLNDDKTCLDCEEKHGKIYRNSNRIYYSNDGLIFVSYDHGQTFYELVR